MLLPEAAVGATYVEVAESNLDRLRVDERPAFVYFILPQPRRMAADLRGNHVGNAQPQYRRLPNCMYHILSSSYTRLHGPSTNCASNNPSILSSISARTLLDPLHEIYS
jgi:hypothetical protein